MDNYKVNVSVGGPVRQVTCLIVLADLPDIFALDPAHAVPSMIPHMIPSPIVRTRVQRWGL